MNTARYYNLEAEIACLGSVLLENKKFNTVFEQLRPEDFYDGRNSLIAKTILEYRQKNGEAVIDIITLTNELTNKQIIGKSGNLEYINALIETIPSTSNVEYYVNIVIEKSLIRNIQKASENLKNYLSGTDLAGKEVLNKVQTELYTLEKKEYQDYQNISDLFRTKGIDTLIKKYESIKKTQCLGIPTTYIKLDDILSGLQETHLLVLGGRPGMGKTGLMTSLAQNIALHDKESQVGVGIFSLEMSREELCIRLLFAEARVDYNHYTQGKMTDEQWKNLTNAASRLIGEEAYPASSLHR